MSSAAPSPVPAPAPPPNPGTPPIAPSPSPGTPPSSSPGPNTPVSPSTPPTPTASPRPPTAGMQMGSIDLMLAECGIADIKEDSTPDEMRPVLLALAERMRDMPEFEQGLARAAAIKKLQAAKIHGPAQLIDQALSYYRAVCMEAARKELPDLLAQTEEMIASYSSEEMAIARRLLRLDPLEIVPALVEGLGHAGEPENARTIYVAMFSSLLSKALGVGIVATSSAGKTHLVETVKQLFPAAVILEITSFSPKALYYLKDLRHKIIIVGERDLQAEGEFGSLAFRELMSKAYLSRAIPVKNEATGEFETIVCETFGPAAYIDTSTSGVRLDEDENRLLAVVSDESEEQTTRVHSTRAKGEDRRYMRKLRRRELLARGFQLYYLLIRRRVLQHRLQVIVPFAKQIAEQLPNRPVKVRRMYEQILGIVRTVALIRGPHHRARKDADGHYIEADMEDWKQAVGIVQQQLPSLAPVDSKATKLLEDMKTKLGKLPTVLTVRLVTETLGISDSTARARLKKLVEAGMLDIDQGSTGGGRGNAARYNVVGPAGPSGSIVLPTDLSP